MAEKGYDELAEQRLGGRTEFQGRILRVEVDRVRTANGIVTTREVIRHPWVVVVLPELADGRIVLVRQFRYPVSEILWELPAGKVDDGESPRECALRELAEETGWHADSLEELGSFYSAPGISDERLVAFHASRLTPANGNCSADADEVLEVSAVEANELRELIDRGELRDAKSLATLFLAARRGLFAIS